jgi:hypothetical protein
MRLEWLLLSNRRNWIESSGAGTRSCSPDNTAIGVVTLASNITGNNNTAIGAFADVSAGNLTDATAIGFQATVNASNKVRLGNTSVTVIEG